MMNECYVIYAKHYNKETKEFEGICIISCVDTEEKVYEFFDTMVSKYNATYVDEYMIYIDHEDLPFLENVTYDSNVTCNFGKEAN
jgi:hypothetical protein